MSVTIRPEDGDSSVMQGQSAPSAQSDSAGFVVAVRAATDRLIARLHRRQAHAMDPAQCAPVIPIWWRQALAPAAIFGNGLLSLPTDSPTAFSRPIELMPAAEIAPSAGGEYLPIAWADGGLSLVLVHDRGLRPVVLVSLTANGPNADVVPSTNPLHQQSGQLIADSLVAFIDMLEPQTVCHLRAGKQSATIELCGELSLLTERDGVIERVDFASEAAVGANVASFLSDAIDAGLRLGYCPQRLRPLIVDRCAAAEQEQLPPEERARRAIEHLISTGHLELVEDDEDALEDLADEAGRFLERHQRILDPTRRFAEWLTQHANVVELYADDDDVRSALQQRHSPQPQPSKD